MLRALSPRHRLVRRLLSRGAEITNSNFFGDACAEAGAQNIGCASLNENPEPVLQSRSQALRAHESEAASKAAACAGGVGMMAAISKLVHRDGMPRPRERSLRAQVFQLGPFQKLTHGGRRRASTLGLYLPEQFQVLLSFLDAGNASCPRAEPGGLESRASVYMRLRHSYATCDNAAASPNTSREHKGCLHKRVSIGCTCSQLLLPEKHAKLRLLSGVQDSSFGSRLEEFSSELIFG